MIPTPRCTNILEIVVLFGDHRNAAHVRSYTADKSHVRGARRQACPLANIWSVLVDFGYICTWVVSYVYTSREQDSIYASSRRTHYVGQRRTRYNDALTSSREHFKITGLARTLTRRSCTLGNPIEYHWHGFSILGHGFHCACVYHLCLCCEFLREILSFVRIGSYRGACLGPSGHEFVNFWTKNIKMWW